jgi:hypothetical protein
LNKDIQQEKISTPNEEDYSRSKDQYTSKENIKISNNNSEKYTLSQDQSGKGKKNKCQFKNLTKN